MNGPYRLLLKNIKQVFTASNKQEYIKVQTCSTIEPAHNISIAIGEDGKISKIGPSNEVEEWINQHNIIFSNIKDCSKLIAIPGLVDAHTHALFAGNRSK
jgi:imidazolonepropionase-like amidohydrolase